MSKIPCLLITTAIISVLQSLNPLASDAADQCRRPVVKILTALGVEKSMTVKSVTGRAATPDPCVIANYRSPVASGPRFALLLKTNERIYLRVPFRLVAQVTRQGSDHVLELTAGDKFIGQMVCSINDYDMASVDKLVVVSAPAAPKESRGHPSRDMPWRLVVERSDKLEFAVRNPRWAYTPVKRNEEEYWSLETPWFHVKAGGQELQAHLPDFQTVSLTRGVGGCANVSLTASTGKQTTGQMKVDDQYLVSRMALFADTADGTVVAVSHKGPKWKLTKAEIDE